MGCQPPNREELEKETIVFRLPKVLAISERAVLGKGSRGWLNSPAGLYKGWEWILHRHSGNHPTHSKLDREEIGNLVQPWISAGPGQESKALPAPREKVGGDRQLWIIEVGSHTVSLAHVTAFSGCGYRRK